MKFTIETTQPNTITVIAGSGRKSQVTIRFDYERNVYVSEYGVKADYPPHFDGIYSKAWNDKNKTEITWSMILDALNWLGCWPYETNIHN
tara:strand:+ start:410 stop:679 length:270 start_codon:yes stop_codon:yes gene_type:complete